MRSDPGYVNACYPLDLPVCDGCGARTAAPIPVLGLNFCSDCFASDKHVQGHDPVNHPQHYTAHPSGIECIEITRHMGFNLGNAVKYIWRADLKGNAIEDLEKAAWYLADEIAKRKGAAK